MIHIGPVAAGRLVSGDPQLRQEFSSRYSVSAFNQADLAAVIESIYGNRKDQVKELSARARLRYANTHTLTLLIAQKDSPTIKELTCKSPFSIC